MSRKQLKEVNKTVRDLNIYAIWKTQTEGILETENLDE